MKRRNFLRFFFLCSCLALAAGEISAAEKRDEMSQYRHILESPVVTVQDMVDLIMMTRGDYAKHTTEAKRFAEARHEGWVKNQAPADVLDRGTLAFAIIKSYPIDRGILFRLTQWNRYALRDVQQANILSVTNSEDHKVSGEQLVGAINAAEEYKQEKDQWLTNH